MDIAGVQLPDVIKEIYHVILLGQRDKPGHECGKQSPIRISFCMRNKRCRSQDGLYIYSVRVACNQLVSFIPLFEAQCLELTSQLICAMQSQEKESHLAIEEVDVKDGKIRKTSVLWLNTDDEANPVTVTILKDSIKYSESPDEGHTVLQLRVFLKMESVILFGKEICDLIRSIKLLNPVIQLSFTMKVGGVAEVELYNTDCIRCDSLNIYCGTGVFFGKYATHFVCDAPMVKTSNMMELKFQDTDQHLSNILLRAVAWFVPMFQSTDENESEGLSQNHYIPGHLSIQVFGPNCLPYDMNIVSKTLSLAPDMLCEWLKFGFQVKTAFKNAAYNLNSSARIVDIDRLPLWAAKCQRFCLMLAFVVSQADELCTDHGNIRSQLNFFKTIEEQLSGKDVLCQFKEAADSCLRNLFTQDDPPCQNYDMIKQEENASDIFRKMIPDVMNSLTDIFTKSTNPDFRSEISSLMPTSSRLSMTTYLSKALWELTPASKYKNESHQVTPDLVTSNTTDSEVDEWDNSQDSLSSEAQKMKSMSPDSLDLEHEWEEVTRDIQCSGKSISANTCHSIESPYNFEESNHNFSLYCPEKSVSNSVSMKETRLATHTVANNEEDKTRHHQLGVHLSHCYEANDHSQNQIPVHGKEVKCNIPCSLHEHLTLSKENFLDKEFEKFMIEENSRLLTTESNEIVGLNDNARFDSANTFTRKRSSEYLDNTAASSDIYPPASPTLHEIEADFHSDEKENKKRQRFLCDETLLPCECRPPHLDFVHKDNMTQGNQPSVFFKSTVDNYSYEGNEVKTDSKLTHRKEDDDSDWFDGDEIDNWYAEMNL